MDAKLKRKWVKALRSGQYRQTKGKLANVKGTAFCCLGVLAHIQGCVWKERGNDNVLVPAHPETNRMIGDGLISSKQFNGALLTHQQEDLAAMNDAGKTFKQIASYIEANL